MQSLGGHKASCKKSLTRVLHDREGGQHDREGGHSENERDINYSPAPAFHDVPVPFDEEEVESPSREGSPREVVQSEGSLQYLMYQKQIEKLYTYGQERMPKVKTTTGTKHKLFRTAYTYIKIP